MSPFSPFNLPMTLVIILIAWAWFSLISMLVSALF